MAHVRVLVTDDSAFMRSAIRRILSAADDIEVVGIATNGLEAIAKARDLQPDVVTLDIEMPQMDGLTALRQIKRVCPAAVLMVSSLTREGSQATLSALRMGAADFIAKDQSQISLKLDSLQGQLVAKVRALGANAGVARDSSAGGVARGTGVSQRPGAGAKPASGGGGVELPAARLADVQIVVIGSSTGGPPVLEQLVASVTPRTPCPIVIAQHMPPLFTEAMAERLDRITPATVVHARPGMSVDPGHIYVAPGGEHTRVFKSIGAPRLRIGPGPGELLYKPSVDELFTSAAEAFGRRTLAIVLTGMGEDGLIGARAISAAGGLILAQDHASCVVYGMPKAVTQAGLADGSCTIDQIAQVLGRLGPARQAAAVG